MARKKTEKVRVPNPARAPKERLDAPPAKVIPPRKRYRRKPKHPGKDDVE